MRIPQLCFGHMFPLMAALLLLLLSGVRCEELTALKPEVCTSEGSSVSLEYSYHKDPAYDDFFWYRQYPGKPPEFMASYSGTGSTITENMKGMKFAVKSMNVSLLLSSAAVGDSAVYYCAVRPNTNTWKLYFGSGTRLTVHKTEDEEPQFYRLEKGKDTVCLASGFSPHNKTYNIPLFNGTNGTYIDREDPDVKGLYSQVALLSPEDPQDICPESSQSLEDTLKPDPAVNLASLTVLGLRILFIKTIAFNVLFTLRLCISR